MSQHPSPPIHPAYRADIDGLRAVAVLAIIIYHTNASWLPGGVASLGIFFVISGFLITSIINKEIGKGQFSFTRFYNRRIKRILPLFYTVIMATGIASFLLLAPSEFAEFGRTVRYAIFFLANMYFSAEQDYFAANADQVPLLHLWTLSVEEQYYLLWPALLLLSRKKFPGYTLALSLLLCVASFTLASLWAMDKSTAQLSYYSLPSRFGEFLIGSLLALYQPKTISRWQANAASFAGSALLIGALLLINDHVVYPGYNALWSCVGTALLIYAGTATAGAQQPLMNRWLALRPVVFTGLISYSLYLWHWPFLAYARYYNMSSALPLHWIGSGFIALFILSYLSWRFVEQPARLQTLSFGQAASRFFIIPTVILVVLCVFIKNSDGYLLRDQSATEGWLLASDTPSPEKLAFARYFENAPPTWNYYKRLDMDGNNRHECNFYVLKQYHNNTPNPFPHSEIDKSCYTRNPALPHAVFIWGDSHAQQLYSGLKQELPASWQILQIASSACTPQLHAKPSATNHCEQSNWFALKTIQETTPDVVIVGQLHKHNAAGMLTITRALQQLGVGKVIFTGPTPHWTAELPKIMQRKLLANTPQRTFTGTNAEIMNSNEKLKVHLQTYPEINFVSIIDVFCNTEGCLTYLGDNKMEGITSYDYGHLTPVASAYLAKQVLVQKVIE